jgi:HTH-type transcriptional regulator, sugar sensing transcriptional regulator
MIERALKKIGLKEKEIKLFLALFRIVEGNTSMVAKKAGISRTTAYDILTKLSKMGLCHRFQKRGQYHFSCEDESILAKYIKKEQHRWEKNESIVEKIIPLMHNIRSPLSPAPKIKFYDGPTEVSMIYDDILDTGQDILLFRSIFDHENEDLAAILDKHIPKQVKKGIHVRALTPWVASSIEHFLEKDKKNLFERRVYKKESFSIPSQIIIYGNKIANISLQHDIFGTVIENEDIVTTQRIVFERLWEGAEKDNKEFLKETKTVNQGTKAVKKARKLKK